MPEETWQQIWNRKGLQAGDKSEYSHAELLAIDGFDSPLGKTTSQSLEHLRGRIRRTMDARPGRSILEVGCGAGAALMLLADTGVALSGVDSSEPHIAIARKSLPACAFQVAEASTLPFSDGVFDGVFSHGVFLYFSDFDYATRVLNEMARVASPTAQLLISDVPDEAKREECEAARRAAGASLTPPHLYFPKDFFREFARERSMACEIFDQDIPGYANSPYRFNAVLSPVRQGPAETSRSHHPSRERP